LRGSGEKNRGEVLVDIIKSRIGMKIDGHERRAGPMSDERELNITVTSKKKWLARQATPGTTMNAETGRWGACEGANRE